METENLTTDFFHEIEDTFKEDISQGAERDDVADFFGVDRSEFSKLIDGYSYALKIERQAMSSFKKRIRKGRLAAIDKGNTTVLKSLEPKEQGVSRLVFEIEYVEPRPLKDLVFDDRETDQGSIA